MKEALLILFVFLIVYWAYAMIANDMATTWLSNNIADINEELKKHACYLYEGRVWRDMAPCMVQWGVAMIGTPREALRQLPARRIKRLIQAGNIQKMVTQTHMYGSLVVPLGQPLFKRRVK